MSSWARRNAATAPPKFAEVARPSAQGVGLARRLDHRQRQQRHPAACRPRPAGGGVGIAQRKAALLPRGVRTVLVDPGSRDCPSTARPACGGRWLAARTQARPERVGGLRSALRSGAHGPDSWSSPSASLLAASALTLVRAGRRIAARATDHWRRLEGAVGRARHD